MQFVGQICNIHIWPVWNEMNMLVKPVLEFDS